MEILESVRNITPYENLRVTTMTHIVSLSTPINKITAFYCLPWERVPLQKKRGSRKCKVPNHSIPGTITSIGDRKLGIRGAIFSGRAPFKNGISINISTTQKNLNLKLSPDTIQMCGSTSDELCREGSNYIVNNIRHIKHCQDRIQQEPETANLALQWVKENTRGESLQRYVWQLHEFQNVNLRIQTPANMDNSIIIPNQFPSEIDEELTKFYLVRAKDFLYHYDFYRYLDHVNTLPPIIQQPLEISETVIAMLNYNYSLGFRINRFKLNELMDGHNGFVSRYNNALRTSVTIERPYDPVNTRVIKRRKGKITKHTFLVYGSGSVMQSGPGGESMRDIYYEFRNIIEELRPYIEDTN